MSYSSPGMSGWRTTLTGSDFGEIGHLRRVGLSGMETEDIDVTTMTSEDAFREFVSGLTDGGEIEMDIVYEKDTFDAIFGDLGEQHGTGASDLQDYTVTFPDGSTFVARGYLKSLAVDSPMDDAIEGTASLKISGKPTFNASS